MVVPVCGLQLKIAIVPGATPFLISNTLLRALGALVDTGNHKLVLPKHHTEVPLKRSEKGLYLIDMNLLLKVQPPFSVLQPVAETFAQESQEKIQNAVKPDQLHVSFNEPKEQTPINTECHSQNVHMQVPSDQGPQVHRSNNFQEKDDNGDITNNLNQHVMTADAESQSTSDDCIKTPITCQRPTEVLSDQSGPLADSNHPQNCQSHEQLGEKVAAPPEHHAASRTGVTGSLDTGCSEGRESFLRKGSQWQNVRGSMEFCPRLDPMVSPPL